MRGAMILVLSAALLLPGCATRGQEFRAARGDLREERAECVAARQSGTRADAREECAERRDARREVQEERREPR